MTYRSSSLHRPRHHHLPHRQVVAIFGESSPTLREAPRSDAVPAVSTMAFTWWLIIIMVGGAFFGIRTFLRTESRRQNWDKEAQLPVFGPSYTRSR